MSLDQLIVLSISIIIFGSFLLIAIVAIVGIKNSFPGSGEPKAMGQKLIVILSDMYRFLLRLIGLYLIVLFPFNQLQMVYKIGLLVFGLLLFFQNEALKGILSNNPVEIKHSMFGSLGRLIGIGSETAAKFQGTETDPRRLIDEESGITDGLEVDPVSLEEDLELAEKVTLKERDAVFRIGLRAGEKTFFKAGNLKINSKKQSFQWDEQ